MRNKRAVEWTDIKELTPLQYVPYVANLFREVTGKVLHGLSQFTGWIGLGGYYHWKVAQQGLLHACPHFQGQLVPRGPMAHPSGRPHPPRSTRTETPAAGASERRQDRAQPTPDQGGKRSTSNQGGKPSTSGGVEGLPPPARVGSHPPQVQVKRHPPPTRAVNSPPQAEVRNQPPREALSTRARRGKEWGTVPGLTGAKGPCAEWKVEPLSPKGLPIQSGRRRQGGRLSARFTAAWMVKTRPHAISPLRPCGPTTLESTPKHCRCGHARYSV